MMTPEHAQVACLRNSVTCPQAVTRTCTSTSSPCPDPFHSTNMRGRLLWLHCLATLGVQAQQTTDSSTSAASSVSSASSASSSSVNSEPTSFAYTNSFSVRPTTVQDPQFTGSQYTYLSHETQNLVTQTTSLSAQNATSSTISQLTQTTAQNNVTEITGGNSRTATATNSAPAVSNTVPCNNYPEFCNRRYSNITEVCAHNSAFSTRNNAASNQVLNIVDQLNDGIRMSSLSHPILQG